MSRHEDFLLEILTEELPPKAMNALGIALVQEMQKHLHKANLTFGAAQYYVTPRRLALWVKNIEMQQVPQMIERKGPAINVAYDQEGKPTPACLGFARSCGVAPAALTTIKNQTGEWVAYVDIQPGKPTIALLPEMIQQSLAALPIPKRMRWGNSSDTFVRPVHAAMVLLGKNIVETSILGQHSNRLTYGHRFHHPQAIKIAHPQDYVELLEKKGYVIADFTQRKNLIIERATAVVEERLGAQAKILFQENVLNEVTGIVEWPIAICGSFDSHFLQLPAPVLISAMQDHQRYFPIVDQAGQLLPYFAAIINIESSDIARVVEGNQRVLRARLADAAFFFTTDQQSRLENRVEALKDIIFQAKLGSLYDKTQRLIQIANYLATQLKDNEALAIRAALLAKADLTTGMVGEFPELQGVMGHYYALHDQETQVVAQAIEDHYKPRFSGDVLPKEKIGQILALADRVDTLVGVFGIHHNPTGDKDPFGLRRAAFGALRLLVEGKIDIDLFTLLNYAASCYGQLENKAATAESLAYILERLKSYWQEQGGSVDEFAAVVAVQKTNLYDAVLRLKAINAFKQLPEAEALAMANKRVSNILAQQGEKLSITVLNPQLFESAEERELAHSLQEMKENLAADFKAHDYHQIMINLAQLRESIDNFFDHVLVMTEDKKKRENRLLLLSQLRDLFLQVADVALLE